MNLAAAGESAFGFFLISRLVMVFKCAQAQYCHYVQFQWLS